MAEHKVLTLDDVAKLAATGHSAFSPSSSKMWLMCSGSLIPNILAADETSKEAAEGTVAHSVAETWLTKGEKAARRRIGDIDTVDGWEIEITEEMLGYVAHYVAWVQEIEKEAKEYLTETRVDFSDLTPIPNQGGTADHIAIVNTSFSARGPYRIVVTDLKYGKGIRVFAEGNTQGLLYAYGAWKLFRDKYKIAEVEIRIAHPRLAEGFTTWAIPIEKLIEFAETVVKPRALAAWRFDAERTPSEDGCQWCKVKGTCAAAYQHMAEVTSGVFDDDEDDGPRSYDRQDQERAITVLEDDLGPEPFQFSDPAKLSTAALAKILRYRAMTEKFFGAVEHELLDRAISREEEVPGWKLVEGRSIRKWPDDEVHVFKRLRKLGLHEDAIYELHIISPAQAEAKLVAKAGLTKDAAAKLINAVAIKPPGKKSLARVSDNRKALPSDGDVFADDED